MPQAVLIDRSCFKVTVRCFSKLFSIHLNYCVETAAYSNFPIEELLIIISSVLSALQRWALQSDFSQLAGLALKVRLKRPAQESGQ